MHIQSVERRNGNVSFYNVHFWEIYKGGGQFNSLTEYITKGIRCIFIRIMLCILFFFCTSDHMDYRLRNTFTVNA